MKKILLLICALSSLYLQAQEKKGIGVGVGVPNKAAMLEVAAKNKGILIPRIELKDNKDQSTIIKNNGIPESLLIYNTTNDSSKKLSSGYYYWLPNALQETESRWVKLLNDTDISDIMENQKNINVVEGAGVKVLKKEEGKDIEFTVSSGLTSKNGIQLENNSFELGGKLDKATEITTDELNTLAIKGLQEGNSTNSILVVENDGVLRKVNAVVPKFFYMPSILLNTEDINTTYSINLYQEYVKQFSNVPANQNSTGKVASLPFIPEATAFEYYVTYIDDSVVKINSVNSQGELSYTILKPAKVSTFVNIVLVVK
ncbi:hypothetical protein [Myroides injenensis]|uniref:hypothetical protein n=1 Tax=Myroides injenensis TaxID=1183151 RepID=UPI000289C3A6|nr:hypothetical protein [Myroides injenensis]